MRWNLAVVLMGTLAATAAGAQQTRTPSAADTDRLGSAAGSIARMKAALTQVLGRAEQARNEKDVVKLNCVNEKLTQIRALIKVAEQADSALRESMATRDAGGDAEFSKIAIARRKVDGLRTDSEQCVGQLAYMVDERTTIEVQQPAGLPGAQDGLGIVHRGENPADAVAALDGTNEKFTPPAIIRPPVASPFR
jgi:hypothetical protein